MKDITKGSEIAVSEGSFKEEWGTSVVIIEGNENAGHRVTATSTASGTDKDQDGYRIRITELYLVIYII